MAVRSKSLVVVPENSVIACCNNRSVPEELDRAITLRDPQMDLSLLFEEGKKFNKLPRVRRRLSAEEFNRKGRRKSHTTAITKDSMSVVLSALYCKLIVIVGLALPITQVISRSIPVNFYNGFYVYLYALSLGSITCLHVIRLKEKILNIICRKKKCKDKEKEVSDDEEKKEGKKNNEQKINNYGSFYLRLGAAAFGIGSMVYSGLELGEYFVTDRPSDCLSPLLAMKPALRMMFTVVQLHFIFLNDASMDTLKNQVLLRFALAHLLATNLCEWLSVIVEETKHEIDHLHPEHNNSFHTNETEYLETDCFHEPPGLLIRDASSYLFPCTIEYSLICAVTLLEMWKDIRIEIKKGKVKMQKNHHKKGYSSSSGRPEYSVDCSHSHQGLVLGLVTTAYTLVSLVAFFSLRGHPVYGPEAATVVVLCEMTIYFASLLAMVTAAIQMRHLPYCLHRLNPKGSLRLGLDLTLLLKAQAGIYMFNMFSGLACWLGPKPSPVWPDVFSVLQTTAQTIFILNTWWKRCRTPDEEERKPGREMLTYLRVVNMALWVISITEKNRAQLRPTQLAFFGTLTWTVITHVSMPLAIFYRFHSAICLFEIWRNAYRGLALPLETQSAFA